MNRVWLTVLLIVLTLIILFIIWPIIFGLPKTEASATKISDQVFRGPTGEPYIKGPTSPPPGQ